MILVEKKWILTYEYTDGLVQENVIFQCVSNGNTTV